MSYSCPDSPPQRASAGPMSRNPVLTKASEAVFELSGRCCDGILENCMNFLWRESEALWGLSKNLEKFTFIQFLCPDFHWNILMTPFLALRTSRFLLVNADVIKAIGCRKRWLGPEHQLCLLLSEVCENSNLVFDHGVCLLMPWRSCWPTGVALLRKVMLSTVAAFSSCTITVTAFHWCSYFRSS